MKKILLLWCALMLVLVSCQTKKEYPAQLAFEKDQTTYKYSVNGDTKKTYELKIPTIMDKEGKVLPIVYSLNPIIENKNELGLTPATLYKEDDIDVKFKNTIYLYALYGFGFWRLNASGNEKVANNLPLTVSDYEILHGDVFHNSEINNQDYVYYYLAAQELIWEMIVDLNTSEPFGIEFEGVDLKPFKQEILDRLVDANETPYFNGTVYNLSSEEIAAQSTISLADEKQVLNRFEVSASEGIEIVSVEENVLSFKVNQLSSNSKISFIPRFKMAEPISKIYSSDENISYLVIGADYLQNNVSALHIESVTNSQTLKLLISTYDSDTKQEIFGGQFEISTGPDFLNPIKSTLSNENVKASISDLSPGTYYIQQVVAPEGYELNSTVEKITIEAGITEKDVPFLNKVQVTEQ